MQNITQNTILYIMYLLLVNYFLIFLSAIISKRTFAMFKNLKLVWYMEDNSSRNNTIQLESQCPVVLVT